jgi:hypothetical protein
LILLIFFVSFCREIDSLSKEKSTKEAAMNLRFRNESQKLISDFLKPYNTLEDVPDHLKKGRYFYHRDKSGTFIYIKGNSERAYFYDGYKVVYDIPQEQLVLETNNKYSADSPDNVQVYLPEPDRKYLSDLVGKIADNKNCLRIENTSDLTNYLKDSKCEVMILEDRDNEVNVLSWDDFSKEFNTSTVDKNDLLDIRDGTLQPQNIGDTFRIVKPRGKVTTMHINNSVSPFERIP